MSVSSSFCVDACSMIGSGVESTICNAVLDEEDDRAARDSGELARVCTLDVLASNGLYRILLVRVFLAPIDDDE